jgi:hypothetical protein
MIIVTNNFKIERKPCMLYYILAITSIIKIIPFKYYIVILILGIPLAKN